PDLCRHVRLSRILVDEIESELPQPDNPAFAAETADLPLKKNAPLWYYLLIEARVLGKRQRLGKIGSLILCETLRGLILGSGISVLRQPGDLLPLVDRADPNRLQMCDLLAAVARHGQATTKSLSIRTP